ncbi:ribonuclease MC-like [Durio zibethinus]|uniref:Ribonuclease MC-like n=1 Tax=Durio zibethinus TaxID=66656 RepID=A0A6P5ZV57_DURZI|nr:ribonuclease MC-like [Durio zibethinus]
MQRYYLLTAGLVACLSSAITLYLVDPQAFFLYNYKLKDLQRPPVSNSIGSTSSTASGTTFAFYKFSLQWPPSTCTSTMPPPGGELKCAGPIPNAFTIHGLWPQDARDNKIRPYDDDPSCTTSVPKRPDKIIPDLQPIEQELKQLWPNLKNSDNERLNQEFWKEEWRKHGMCSDYAEVPFGYFNSSLELRKGFHPVFKLEPGATYTAQCVAEIVRAQVGAEPEIACSKSRVENNKLLLWEVRLCYNKTTYPKREAVQDCKKGFSGQCKKSNNKIKIPSSPQYPSGEY